MEKNKPPHLPETSLGKVYLIYRSNLSLPSCCFVQTRGAKKTKEEKL